MRENFYYALTLALFIVAGICGFLPEIARTLALRDFIDLLIVAGLAVCPVILVTWGRAGFQG